jgi:hypothetical protein
MQSKYSQVQRSISALMIFVLLASTTGCAGSRRVISVLAIPEGMEYYYFIHDQGSYGFQGFDFGGI